MAIRPVFSVSLDPPFFDETLVNFEYHSGFALVQAQKSVRSLHQAYLLRNTNCRILEISGKSESELGAALSAFNLMTKANRSVEVEFQASKVFEKGGPYTDLLALSSREAKKRPVIKKQRQTLAL